MAGVIDSLMVTLGLDPSKFKAGVENVRKDLQRLDNGIKQTGGQVEQLGNKWGGTLSGIVKSLAGPLLAGASVGAMLNSYTSDIAKVAKQQGVYNEKLEEERKKKALLQRITKEDLDLYKKSREAMSKFDIATSNLSATFMRTFAPAMRFAVDVLNRISSWIDRNQNNITRFLLVVASIVSTALIPAFARWAKTMLANPITWLVVAIGALALIIDDLVTYIQDGDSAFASFWSQFGTGEQILEKFKGIWQEVLDAFDRFKAYIPMIARTIGVMVGFKTAATVIRAVTAAVSALGKAFMASLPIMLIAGIAYAIADLISYIQGGESSLQEFWALFGTGKEIAETLQQAFGSAFELIKSLITDLFGFWKALFTGNFEEAGKKLRSVFENAINAIKGMFMGLFNGIKKLFSSLSLDSILNFGGKVLDGITDFGKGFIGGGKPSENQTQAAIPPSAQVTTNNDTTVTNTTNVGTITINTTATDANGLARDVGPAIQRNAPGWATNGQSGVWQ